MSVKYSKLLNTAEAAQFLRVSQASVRRWFDAGLLPGHRIGRRRERRFSESDLLAFMDRSPSKKAGPQTVSVGGVSAEVPVHLATLISSDEGGLRVTGPFLAEGVRLGQPCFLVGSKESVRRYRDATGAGAGIEPVHFGGGAATDAIAQWERLFSHAVAKGPTVIRVVGEMADERAMFASDEVMFRYEESFELMCRRYPVAVICQYDARKFDGVSLLRALKVHPELFGLRTGAFLN